MKRQSLMSKTAAWVISWNQLSVAVLAALVISSALAVIYSSHMTRKMYSQLQTLQKEQDDLDSKYEKLLLEQSAWADYTRVDQVARGELGMRQPGPNDLVIVRQ